MKRRDILKGLGVLGLGSLLPVNKAKAAGSDSKSAAGTSCILIPQETSGPYPYDLSANTAMYRQNITEGNTGTQLDLTLTIVNVNNNCSPIANARVDIWHCNKDGYYSEYNNQPGYLGTGNYAGQTFFRGIQMTDSNGQVKFTTIYPGWYTGRVTHIHVQVFLNSVLNATTQMAFPDTLNTTVYNTSLYSAHGQNSTTNSNDNVFSDTANTQYELLSPTANTTTGGYDAALTIGIDSPVSGVINLEPETGGQFKLKQNFPNPFRGATEIPFSLTNPSAVEISLFDMSANKVATVINQHMSSGDQVVKLAQQLGGQLLPAGNYVYQITVKNDNGTFRQCKVLTVE